MSVLIIAPEADLHARVVAERLEAMQVPWRIWNTAWFPSRQRVSWRPAAGTLVEESEATFFPDTFSSIWWRRFHPPVLDPGIGDESVRRFCYGEAITLLRAVFETTGARVINEPHAERRAESKPLQLKIASELGLQIPDTIISNRRDDIVDFLSRHARCVCKPLVCDYVTTVPTRECAASDFAMASEVALAPTIVQELVEADVDVRVTVVGTAVFPAELRRDDTNLVVDWRVKLGSTWTVHALPERVGNQLVAVTRALGLDVASFDLRRRNGEYVFLEVNPSGQFLFLEADAGLAVSSEVATLLARSADRPKGNS